MSCSTSYSMPYPVLCRIALAIGLSATVTAGAWAQPASPANQAVPPAAAAPAAPAAAAADSAESMDPPMVGDHWTYELRDEISGELKNTLIDTVTDVTPSDIAVRVQNQAYSQGPAVFIYDRSWNLKNSPGWKFSPNDGTGVKMPLAVGKTWKFRDDLVRGGYGFTFKNTGTSKVVGTESITTDAGTFQALKIETLITGHNSNDSTKHFESTMTTWYVPSLDHWIKRTVKSAFNGSVDENDSFELIDYGRR